MARDSTFVMDSWALSGFQKFARRSPPMSAEHGAHFVNGLNGR
jgi:hypothetical protein